VTEYERSHNASEAKEVSGDLKIHRIFGLGSNHNLLQQVGNFDPALEQIQGTKAGKPKEPPALVFSVLNQPTRLT
jgi:hypothetical protein